MIRFLLSRLLQGIIVILAVITITFALSYVRQIREERIQREIRREYRARANS